MMNPSGNPPVYGKLAGLGEAGCWLLSGIVEEGSHIQEALPLHGNNWEILLGCFANDEDVLQGAVDVGGVFLSFFSVLPKVLSQGRYEWPLFMKMKSTMARRAACTCYRAMRIMKMFLFWPPQSSQKTRGRVKASPRSSFLTFSH
ncbi:hypothetical protein Hamer_G002560 [Homarus americanus]|uniref:Uncharacterized protein n=1 Tax=Homarus americanus TaxID=6706 RepID=A0A8J5MXW8_HOMAM|nr:hypothetical protein Hamer_G002560 [Homarus americanus]